MSPNAFARACLAALPLACAPALSAQAPAYARDPADTLVYRETLRGTVDTDPTAGGHIVQERRAELSLTFAGGDTVRAWYQRVEQQGKGRNGSQELVMPGQSMLGGFTLLVTPSGRVRTLAVPTYPPPMDLPFDSIFGEQFVDFLPVLPDTPLRAGLEWTAADSASPGLGRYVHSTRYRVLRDTTLGGLRAVIVETETRLVIRRVDVVDEELSVPTELQGTERGRFIFAPERGILLRRERTGTLRGTETYENTTAPRRVYRQAREYTRVTELLSGARR